MFVQPRTPPLIMNDLSGNYPTDIFTPYYSHWMNMAFAKMKPDSWSDLFPLMQYHYRSSPDKFVVTSPLHQNDAQDNLHFSVEFKLPYTTYRFHIYGYYKNIFVIQKITCHNNYLNTWSEPTTLASFLTF